jgi:hypothetical protein
MAVAIMVIIASIIVMIINWKTDCDAFSGDNPEALWNMFLLIIVVPGYIGMIIN